MTNFTLRLGLGQCRLLAQLKQVRLECLVLVHQPPRRPLCYHLLAVVAFDPQLLVVVALMSLGQVVIQFPVQRCLEPSGLLVVFMPLGQQLVAVIAAG